MNYKKISSHYNDCFIKNGDSHLGVDWPNQKDANTRYQIMYESILEDSCSLLDFGVGLGHFYEWLNINSIKNIKFSGLDINSCFYESCKIKFPSIDLYLKDILTDDDIPQFDYIVCNGTFTEKLDLSQDEMMNFLKSVLLKLWPKCNKGIAFNLMSKHVDWERDDLFHVSLDEIGWFLKQNLSRNFIIRNDYKLYEYTVYAYK